MVSLVGFLTWLSPTEPCALRSTQPLKVSTRDFSWCKDGRCVWLTTYHPCSAETSRKSGVLTYRNPLGHLGLLRETFTLLYDSWRTVNILGGDNIGYFERKGFINTCLTMNIYPVGAFWICRLKSVRLLFVGLDDEISLPEKGGYTRRIVRSHFLCCCLHKET
jgi:hypothetical protein